MPLSFGNGVTIQVVAPNKPTVRVAPPSPASLALVPVQGPAGPAGPPGDSVAALSFVQNVTAQSTILINTGLPFKPAGITCIDTAGDTVYGATITYPAAGFIEIQFGVQFSGVIYLS
jgi:hypothetical protein